MPLDRFLAHQRHLAHAAEDRRRALATAIRTILPQVLAELVALGARRVILFGSVARGEADEDSDIDLAVEGLAPELHFTAMGRAWHAAGRPVDLVRLEDAPPALRARVLSDGEVLRDAG